MTRSQKYLNSESGSATPEYALLVALFAMAILPGATTLMYRVEVNLARYNSALMADTCAGSTLLDGGGGIIKGGSHPRQGVTRGVGTESSIEGSPPPPRARC